MLIGSGLMALNLTVRIHGDKPVETGNLKLQAQKITEFSGAHNEWAKWKNRTECALDGSGYESILNNRPFADINLKMNKVVYYQLLVATTDGSAHHLVK